ncbi:MAG: hypothetical protein AVDCRST_MAG43-851 [uncultured Thermomicrobiales bacterium]|uniref:Uncharacterized protein n=1 Tax=uncultured Thermomicrobiales bacterium TaxID=1645740 RepID=A0A6J4UHZ1_9BACT|nr:MAG: hypothetical protein AVDCRST_MAG43-851 [uncultured Thermomicrobiales bacterium]
MPLATWRETISTIDLYWCTCRSCVRIAGEHQCAPYKIVDG